MLRSLFAGVSGLRSHQVRVDVIGNNIANVNTIGYKSSRVQFREAFSQTLQAASRSPGGQGGVNPQQVGLGTQIGSIDQNFNQGSLQSTGLATDLAIQGDAFFVLRRGTERTFTRDGGFQLDPEGRLVSATNGFTVQGRTYKDGVLQDEVSDITIPFGLLLAAKQTTSTRLVGNLNAAAPVFSGNIDSAADRAKPENAISVAEAQIGVYDSLGERRSVKIQMWKTASNKWNWRVDPTASATVERFTTSAASPPAPIALPAAPAGYEIKPANVRVTSTSGDAYSSPADYTVAAGPPAQVNFTAAMPSNTSVNISYFMSPTTPDAGVNSGELTFDAAGMLVGRPSARAQFAVPGAEPMDITLDLGGGAAGLTQFSAGATTRSTPLLRDQDGYSSGVLQDFSIDALGTITGVFSNGSSTPLARISLADFNNTSGLLRLGDNMYQESANSGVAVLGLAREGTQSTISSGMLEMSNVDLSQEFTALIVAQRGFQASSKVVTSADEMLQDITQLKR